MLYVQLDTNWPDHPKIIRAGIDGAGLHAIALCLAKRLETDGWIDMAVLYRQGATDELVERLVDLDLLERSGDRVRPDGWLDRNPSQAAIAARRASKVEAGRRGNHKKWGHDQPFEECALCHPNPQVIAGCDRTGSQDVAGDRSPTKQKPESTPEVTIAIGGATVDFEHHDIPTIPKDHVELARQELERIKNRRSLSLLPGGGSALPDPSATDRDAPASPLRPSQAEPQGREDHGGAA